MLLIRSILFSLSFWLCFCWCSAFAAHVVAIDPGHGGNDPGVSISRSAPEKNITLSIAKLIDEGLRKTKNISVVLTRNADKGVSPGERIDSVTKAKADLFVSLHVNAGFGKDAAGYEVYFLGFGYKFPSAQKDKQPIVDDMVRTTAMNGSIAFAQTVQKNMEKIFPRQGRGLREGIFPILEGLHIPAVIVEIGFATNKADREVLTSSEGQRAIADAFIKSIQEYYSTFGDS